MIDMSAPGFIRIRIVVAKTRAGLVAAAAVGAERPGEDDLQGDRDERTCPSSPPRVRARSLRA